MTEEDLAALILQQGAWPEPGNWAKRIWWLEQAGIKFDYLYPPDNYYSSHPLFAQKESFKNEYIFIMLEKLTKEEVYEYLRKQL